MNRASFLASAVVYLFAVMPLDAAAENNPRTIDAKPVVYSYFGKASEGSAAVKSVYGRKFRIVDFTNERAATRSKATKKVSPRPLYESGEMIEGSVRVVFIVTDKGQVLEPFVLSSTSHKLNRTVLETISRWRGTPARLNGAPIAVVHSQDFIFTKRRR